MTLVELMVSLLAGLGCLYVLCCVCFFANRHFRRQEAMAGFRERGQLASTLLAQEVRRAGRVQRIVHSPDALYLLDQQGVESVFFIQGSHAEHFRQGLFFGRSGEDKMELVAGISRLQADSSVPCLLSVRLDAETGEAGLKGEKTKPWFVDVAVCRQKV